MQQTPDIPFNPASKPNCGILKTPTSVSPLLKSKGKKHSPKKQLSFSAEKMKKKKKNKRRMSAEDFF